MARKDRPLDKTSQGARAHAGGRRVRAETVEWKAKQKEFDRTFGFEELDTAEPRVGWLLNFNTSVSVGDDKLEYSCLEMFFLKQDGSCFKAFYEYRPYFLVEAREDTHKEVATYLQRRFQSVTTDIAVIEKRDMDQPNHLSGIKQKFVKLSFRNVQDLMFCRKQVMPIAEHNKKKENQNAAYEAFSNGNGKGQGKVSDNIVGLREYDVPYHVRVAIDNEIRVGSWYRVTKGAGVLTVEHLKDMFVKAEPRVLAFDIECTKAPLKFPVADVDQIFMISYMIDGQGYLIISREVVSKDINNFVYTPKPTYPGPFTVFNEKNELALIRRFFQHIQETKPNIFVTFNGDFFDWPFLEERARKYGISMLSEIGIQRNRDDTFTGRCAVHMDAFCWVKRDSYLPQGSQGLKAVTRKKLGYDPVEVDPEDMVKFAHTQPEYMASYSVSDAVATYYLYMKYVHHFVFSLCTIIPMGSEDVLRKGSGTLCEQLLMVEAFRGQIVCPNKQKGRGVSFYKGHLLENETYVGGHVEALQSGVFRNDIPNNFKLEPAAYQGLIDKIDRSLTFALEVESGYQRADVVNYEEIRSEIVEKLELLRDTPNRKELPVIYHLDVAAMYPNIILTNRLQPHAIVDESVCASCDYNDDRNECKRPLEWVWRGEYSPVKQQMYEHLKMQITYEEFDGIPYHELPPERQKAELKKRVKGYAQKVHKQVKITEHTAKLATVCQRENSFYIETVRNFRDRRYEYKKLTKTWFKAQLAARKKGDEKSAKEADDKTLLYDSLQLAHKCILNSFYGYVMRKGARWQSMEMAAITTNTGSSLIKQARQLVERIGVPLELDTDGIWCILPGSFPENFKFKLRDGDTVTVSYPCVMLNVDVHDHFTNHQYQDLSKSDGDRKPGESRTYEKRSENSIFFEVDGPYKAMILPASTEEGKLLKKRYAVFNLDGTLAELKGFEMKRRGELQLIKTFQEQVFENFLGGQGLAGCYESVARIANFWLDVLDSQAEDMEEDEVIDLMSEKKNLSRALSEYGSQKSTAITTAKRLSAFLGNELVQNSGLSCHLLISKQPAGAPVTERAIPVAIFGAAEAVKAKYLRLWCHDPAMTEFDVRDIIDWDYYFTRFADTVRKIITIPAALQDVDNPVDRVVHPDWLKRVLRERNNPFKQQKISSMFKPSGRKTSSVDLEDIGSPNTSVKTPLKGRVARVVKRTKKARAKDVDDGDSIVEIDSPESTGSANSVDDLGSPESDPIDVSEDEDEDEPTDIATWLTRRKKKWKANRESRKRRLESTGSSRIAKPSIRGGMSSYMRDAASAALNGYWQIIAITPTQREGLFKVFALTGPTTVQSINLEVPRLIYVNSRREEDSNDSANANRRVVLRTLPRDAAPLHLVQLKLSEDQFVHKSKQLDRTLTHKDVEGVYETQVPLDFTAVQHLGCVTRIKPGRRSALEGEIRKGSAAKFTLDDFDMLSASSHDYLSAKSSVFEKLWLYHSTTDSRGLWLACARDTQSTDTNSYRCNAWIINPYSASESTPNFGRIFKELQQIASQQSEAQSVNGESSHQDDSTETSTDGPKSQFSQIASMKCVFDVHVVKSKTEALRAVNEWLDFQNLHMRTVPTVVAAQCTSKAASIEGSGLSGRLGLPALKKFPVVKIPSNQGDSQYPVYRWQNLAARTAINRFLTFDQWWNHRLQWARYSGVPIGNMGDDLPSNAADVLFARVLEKAKFLLWASPGPLPDLGGKESDEYSAKALTHNPRISNPGSYRRVCIEFSLHNLAANTLVNASNITNIEGSESALALDVVASTDDGGFKGRTALDEAATCAKHFKMLRAIVCHWLTEVVQDGDDQADQLLMNAYRWICSSTSMLYEPALHSMLLTLMRKVFLQLLATFRSLGSTIVFADFSRIIISTRRRSAADAANYAAYIVETITKKDLFRWLSITPDRYWGQLLFMDNENFGGIDITQDARAAAEHDEGYLSQETLDMHWNLANYLTPEARTYFHAIVGQFLEEPYRYLQQVLAEAERAGTNTTMTQQEERLQAYVEVLIQNEFTPRLMDKTALVQKHDRASDFPKLAGSHLNLQSPALEFVKAVCHILQLELSVESVVNILKVQLLRLCAVRDFSPESKWQNPSLEFILHDVTCSFCNDCADLDLCRNVVLTASESAPEKRWKCKICHHPYNLATIEHRLVDQFETLFTKSQLQDLRCSKCGAIKPDNIQEYCSCSGSFECAESSPADMEKHLLIFRRVAEWHKFEWLLEVVTMTEAVSTVSLNAQEQAS